MNIKTFLICTILIYAEALCIASRFSLQHDQPIRSVQFSPNNTHLIYLNDAKTAVDQTVTIHNLKTEESNRFFSNTFEITERNFLENSIKFPAISQNTLYPVLLTIPLYDQHAKYGRIYIEDDTKTWKSFAQLDETTQLSSINHQLLIFNKNLLNLSELRDKAKIHSSNQLIEHVLIAPDNKKIAALSNNQTQANVFILDDHNNLESCLKITDINNHHTFLFNQESSLIISAHDRLIHFFNIRRQEARGVHGAINRGEDTKKPYLCKIPDFFYDIHAGFINALALSPDGNYLASASADGTVNLCVIESTRDLAGPHIEFDEDSINQALSYQTRLMLEEKTSVNHIRFSPDNKLLAGVASNGKVYVWYMANYYDSPEILDGLTSPGTYVAFSSNSKRIVAGSESGEICVWNI